MADNIARSECNKTREMFMKEIKDIKKDVNEIKVDLASLPEKLIEKLDDKYVPRDLFEPIQKLVYGLVGAILLGIVGAGLALILK